MINSWQKITEMANEGPLIVEKIKLIQSDISICGNFELSPLAQLTIEDQLFVASFIKIHGSIKEMEKIFNVSYPTIKNKLNKISKKLSSLTVDVEQSELSLLNKLDRGEIDVETTLKELKK